MPLSIQDGGDPVSWDPQGEGKRIGGKPRFVHNLLQGFAGMRQSGRPDPREKHAWMTRRTQRQQAILPRIQAEQVSDKEVVS
jgi:hypothetical protein